MNTTTSSKVGPLPTRSAAAQAAGIGRLITWV